MRHTKIVPEAAGEPAALWAYTNRMHTPNDETPTAPLWTPQTPLVTGPELPALWARHKVVVIHCGAAWNGQDKRVDDALQPLRREFAGQIAVYAMDFDPEINWDFLREFGLVSIPILLCFINGKLHETLSGARSENEMRETFRTWLAFADAVPGEETG